MKIHLKIFSLFLLSLSSCQLDTTVSGSGNELVKIAGAMKNVMHKGELEGIINLDTITDKEGLYAIGPVSYLTGEILINNGVSYVSRVSSDSSMTVEKTFDVSAPFLVYGHVTEWQKIDLPADIENIKNLETYINEKTKKAARPFVFKLKGTIESATIHVQNLPAGSKVSSPKEAHAGQVKYYLKEENVEIVGFFSTKHQGVFTHHDTYLHMHLITQDETKMGHLDEISFGDLQLYLPTITQN